jgi:hypothetical protein
MKIRISKFIQNLSEGNYKYVYYITLIICSIPSLKLIFNPFLNSFSSTKGVIFSIVMLSSPMCIALFLNTIRKNESTYASFVFLSVIALFRIFFMLDIYVDAGENEGGSFFYYCYFLIILPSIMIYYKRLDGMSDGIKKLVFIIFLMAIIKGGFYKVSGTYIQAINLYLPISGIELLSNTISNFFAILIMYYAWEETFRSSKMVESKIMPY